MYFIPELSDGLVPCFEPRTVVLRVVVCTDTEAGRSSTTPPLRIDR